MFQVFMKHNSFENFSWTIDKLSHYFRRSTMRVFHGKGDMLHGNIRLTKLNKYLLGSKVKLNSRLIDILQN